MKCEICNGKMKPVYPNMSKREQTKFYRCTSCKLIWAPKLNVSATFSSKLNEGNRQKALQDVRQREFRQVNTLVRRYVPKRGKGLDIGCAYGWYMKSVSREYVIEGIEPEDSVARKARANGNQVYTGFFPEDLPDNAGKYDFLVFNNVWEHINHTSELLENSLGFLKPGGIMVITVPLSAGGLYRIAELFEKAGRTKELARLWQLHFHSPHVYYFTKENLTKLMKKYGCRILEYQDVRGIAPERMKERFEMDQDERHGAIKAIIFRLIYPLLRLLPSDKAVFVFQYRGTDAVYRRKYLEE